MLHLFEDLNLQRCKPDFLTDIIRIAFILLLNYACTYHSKLPKTASISSPKMSFSWERLTKIVLVAIPTCLYAKYIHYHFQTKKQMEETERNHKKHNCVVTYARGWMEGWPEYPGRHELTLKNLHEFKEPLIYFIDTAAKQLDICMMSLSCPDVINALSRALKRGVAMRLLLDCDCNRNSRQVKQLAAEGADVIFHVKDTPTSIMHNKYAVKDFKIENHSGFTVSGSMNWCESAFINNYECLVFTSNKSAVGNFNKNFVETWYYMTKKIKDMQMNQ